MTTAVEKSVEALHEGFAALRGDVKGIEASISKISEAITRLAVLEERHQGMASAFTKLTEKVDTLTERQHQAELARQTATGYAAQIQQNTVDIRQLQLKEASFDGKTTGAGTLAKAVWTVVGGVITAVVIMAFSNTFVPSQKAQVPQAQFAPAQR